MKTLHVPTFARLSEYAGLWAIEPMHAANLWRMAEGMDFASHYEEADEPKAVVELVSGPPGKSIAVVKMTGLLMKQSSSIGGTSTIQLRREIRQAADSPDVAGILLAVDSPGGTVAGTDDLARDVKMASRSKPVWAHIEDLGASAAFWVASQAQKITANSPTALIGSIGTMQVILDQSAAAEQAGIKALLFATGPLKGLGTPGAKVTDEQIAHVQGLVSAVQESFDAAVQKGRRFSKEQLAAVRHGGVMTAPQALAAGLIDAIQSLDKTKAEFAQALKPGQRAASTLPMVTRQRLPMRA